MAQRLPTLLLLLTAALAGCAGDASDPALAAAPGQSTATVADADGAGPAEGAQAATWGAPSTRTFEQSWTLQAGQGEGAVYALRSASPVADLPLNATGFLVEVRWEAEHDLAGDVRLSVRGPQGEWGAAVGAGDLRLRLPADAGGHQGTLDLEVVGEATAAVQMRATYYVTAFQGGPADPAFTALPA